MLDRRITEMDLNPQDYWWCAGHGISTPSDNLRCLQVAVTLRGQVQRSETLWLCAARWLWPGLRTTDHAASWLHVSKAYMSSCRTKLCQSAETLKGRLALKTSATSFLTHGRQSYLAVCCASFPGHRSTGSQLYLQLSFSPFETRLLLLLIIIVIIIMIIMTIIIIVTFYQLEVPWTCRILREDSPRVRDSASALRPRVQQQKSGS